MSAHSYQPALALVQQPITFKSTVITYNTLKKQPLPYLTELLQAQEIRRVNTFLVDILSLVKPPALHNEGFLIEESIRTVTVNARIGWRNLVELSPRSHHLLDIKSSEVSRGNLKSVPGILFEFLIF